MLDGRQLFLQATFYLSLKITKNKIITKSEIIAKSKKYRNSPICSKRFVMSKNHSRMLENSLGLTELILEASKKIPVNFQENSTNHENPECLCITTKMLHRIFCYRA